MEYRKSGTLDAAVSLLGFGCMRFPLDGGGHIREEESSAMLHRALEAGVNYFDTAYFYLGGQSESFVGKALSNVPRDRYYLATKMPCLAIETAQDAPRFFATQQQRLRTNYFDFYLMHALNRTRWDKMQQLGVLDFCQRMQQEGKIRRLGFSFHDDYEVFEEILRSRNWDFCQIQLNYLDTEEQAGMRGYRLAEELGVPVVVMEPVKGGALANPPEDLRDMLQAARPELSVPSWAMRWVGGLPNVLTVLSGMTQMAQLEDNLKTYTPLAPLNAAEQTVVTQVAGALKRRVKNGCTDCRYCMPCPAGVNIPENFKIWNLTSKTTDGKAAWRPWNLVMPEQTKAKQCVACGQCEPLCPQQIHIRADLARAQAELDALQPPEA